MNEDWKAIFAMAVCLLLACAIVYFVHRIALSGAEIARDNKLIAALECIGFMLIVGFLVENEVVSHAMMFRHLEHTEKVSLLWKILAVALTVVGSIGIYVGASALMKKLGLHDR
jgi:hypothetical protein